MPCKECENGKWRWGESGECQYDTLAECETANADYDLDESNKKRKYYGDDEHDYHFNFTTDMMEKLHSTGELEVNVERDGKEMSILFTYDAKIEEETYDALTNSLLDDELDEYIVKLTNSIKKL